MSEIDQQFIEYVVKSLVGKPDAVSINRTIDEKGVLLELTVDPDDLGRVIGKRGATAQSLRTLLRALGTKNDARYNLKIIDNGTGGPGGQSSGDDAQADDKDDKPQKSAKPAPDKEESEEPAEEQPEEAEPESAEEPPADDTPAPDDGASDRLAQTRRELADLDDLDV
jgi:hypothetical protein